MSRDDGKWMRHEGHEGNGSGKNAADAAKGVIKVESAVAGRSERNASYVEASVCYTRLCKTKQATYQ